MDDMPTRLMLLSARIDNLLSSGLLSLDARQKLALSNLSYYTGKTLANVAKAGRAIREDDVRLVNGLERAMQIIDRDGKVEMREIQILLRIADDLSITAAELDELSNM